MNNPIIKILKFEFGTNYRLWTMKLFVAISLMLTVYYLTYNQHNPSKVFDFEFFVFAIATLNFTFKSYQESVKNQSMQIYHLLPVSQSTKFFSKQVITIFTFPFLILVVYLILVSVTNIIIDRPFMFSNILASEKLLPLVIFWILGHSISTFFAIFFKRNKSLYSVIIMIVMLTSVAAINRFVTILFDIDYFIAVTGSPLTIVPESVSYILPIILYIASYRLFTRRQL